MLYKNSKYKNNTSIYLLSINTINVMYNTEI